MENLNTGFSLKVMPDVRIYWVKPIGMALAQLVQSPCELNETCVLVIAASVVQDLYDVELLQSGCITGTPLYGCIVGPSGLRKSSAEQRLLKWVALAEETDRIEYERQLQEQKEQKARDKISRTILAKKLASALKAGYDSEVEKIQDEMCLLDSRQYVPPARNKRTYRDVTVEKMLFDLAVDKRGKLWVNSELTDINRRFIGPLNDLWSNQPLSIERKVDGSIEVIDKRLSALLQTQQQHFDRIKNKTGDSGFFYRYLVVRPVSNIGSRAYNGGNNGWSLGQIEWFNNRLRILDNKARQLNGVRELLTFDEMSKVNLINYYNEMESSSGKQGWFNEISGYTSKALENCVRIAAVIFAISGMEGLQIPVEITNEAIGLSRFYVGQARILLGGVTPEEISFDAAMQIFLFLASKPHYVGTEFKRSYLDKFGPNALRGQESMEMGLVELQRRGIIKYYPAKRNGRLFIEPNFCNLVQGGRDINGNFFNLDYR